MRRRQWEQASAMLHKRRGTAINCKYDQPQRGHLSVRAGRAMEQEQALSLLHKMCDSGMTAGAINFGVAHLSVREGRAVGAGIGATSQNARYRHLCQFDLLQCGHFSVREGIAMGTCLDVASLMCATGMSADRPYQRARRECCGKCFWRCFTGCEK